MDDVDVFVGLVSETHVPGALVGPTLACLLGSQFRDIKFGDRFFYETRGQEEGFTEGRRRLPNPLQERIFQNYVANVKRFVLIAAGVP